MRLRERDLVTVFLKRFKVQEDEEGNAREGYDSIAIPIKMNVQSAGGYMNATIYGQRLPYIKDCKYQGDVELNEKDGICLYRNVLSIEEVEKLGYSMIGFTGVGKAPVNGEMIEPDIKPDYKIISIQPFSTHINVKLEKIDAHGR